MFINQITLVYFDNKDYSSNVNLFLLRKYIVIYCFPMLNFWTYHCLIKLKKFTDSRLLSVYWYSFFSCHRPFGKVITFKKFIKCQFAKVSTREMQFSERKTFSRAFKLKLVVPSVPDQCSRPKQIWNFMIMFVFPKKTIVVLANYGLLIC